MLHLKNYFLMPLSPSWFQGFLLNKCSMGWRTQKTQPRNRRLTYKVVQITRYVRCVLYQYELQKFCSIIRFLNIIQNSTKPWEREDSARCFVFKQMFPLYWTELLKINTPWKEGTEPSSFYASPACTQAETSPFTDWNPDMKELSEVRVHIVNILLLNTFKRIICSNISW